MSESTPVVDRCHLNLSDGLSEDLVLNLPEAVNFIDRGLKDVQHRQQEQADGAVLVHSFDLTRICVTICAYCEPFRVSSSLAHPWLIFAFQRDVLA